MLTRPTRVTALRNQLLLCLLSSFALTGCNVASISNSISNGNTKSNDVQALIRVQPDGAETAAFKNTQLALLKARFVLRRALRPPEIAHNPMLKDLASPVEWLGENIKAQYLGDSNILEVTLSSSDTKNATMIVNAVVDAYLDEFAQAQRRDIAGRLENLRSTHREMTRDLQELMEVLEKLGTKVGAPESKLGSLNRQFALDRVSQLARRVGTLEDELITSKLECFEEAADPDSDITSTKTDTPPNRSTLRCKALAAAIKQQQKLLEQAKEELRGLAGFSAELETKKIQAEILKQLLMTTLAEIQEQQKLIKLPDSVQLLQRATTADKKAKK